MNNWIQFLFLDLYNALSVWTLVSTDKSIWLLFMNVIIYTMNIPCAPFMSQQCAESWRMGENPRLQCDNVHTLAKMRIQCIRNIMKKNTCFSLSVRDMFLEEATLLLHILKQELCKWRGRVNRRKDVFKVTVKKEGSCQETALCCDRLEPSVCTGVRQKMGY